MIDRLFKEGRYFKYLKKRYCSNNTDISYKGVNPLIKE